jgi:hypothetical protein
VLYAQVVLNCKTMWCCCLSPGVTELYLKTMDALDAITPGVPIYFVEGAGQTGLRGVNWGNGFVTERGLIARNGLSGRWAVVEDRCSSWLCVGSMPSSSSTTTVLVVAGNCTQNVVLRPTSQHRHDPRPPSAPPPLQTPTPSSRQ